VGLRVVRERIDDRAAAGDLVERLVRELDGGAVAGDGDDVLEARRADAHGDGGDGAHERH
jgi:hypothetical protein